VSKCRCGLAPIAVLEEDVRQKKKKVPKVLSSAPIMQLDKPFVTDVDYYNIDLSWTPASLPPNSTPTSFTYVNVPGSFIFVALTTCGDLSFSLQGRIMGSHRSHDSPL